MNNRAIVLIASIALCLVFTWYVAPLPINDMPASAPMIGPTNAPTTAPVQPPVLAPPTQAVPAPETTKP